MITAKVIEDSTSEDGVRLTTLQLKYPRLVHSEFMTHRVFSRNASSSRAIPVAKMIEMVRTDPAMPVHWGSNKPGMQAGEELSGANKEYAIALWIKAANQAADIAETMMRMGLHKQVANRILEPFQHIHVVVTATEFDNFFALRDHEAADPNIQVIARAMKAAMEGSTPIILGSGEWHLPYVTVQERVEFGRSAAGYELLCKLSAARCARVSYLKHDGGKPNIEDDLKLYDRLVGAMPIHASPVEHQATPDTWMGNGFNQGWGCPGLHGNFVGWIQNRKLVEQQFAH